MTECNRTASPLQPLGRREVVANFDGGTITSDGGGAILLRELENRNGIIRRFADCFTDHRDPELIEHTVYDLVAQRVFGLALGYEDLNDHDILRLDPALALLVGKDDPTGEDRARARDQGKALAGKSTLNRLELTPPGADESSRYKKIVASCASIEEVFVDVFMAAHPVPPERIVLDLDATDDIIHGNQLGRFFHGYYKNYCYLPLYIFCGEHLLCAKLRPSNIDASAGTTTELRRIVSAIRAQWPTVEILIRGDSGFCRDEIMAWCERENVGFILGLAKNKRLNALLAPEMQQAKEQFEKTAEATRVFKDFEYRTLDSWTRARRTVGKAEHLAAGPNPRFVVTSLSSEAFDAATLYEKQYCGRGDMENRIKEQQLYLFADRTSAHTMRANQLRLSFSSLAYTVLVALRQHGLAGTEMESARCDTIRLKLLKIGAQVQVTVRKIWISLSEAYPYRKIFEQVMANICRLAPTPLRC
jgi:Transposase DDE domain group 1